MTRPLNAFLVAAPEIAMTLRADLAHDELPVHFTWDGAPDVATALRRLPESSAEIVVLEGGDDPLGALHAIQEAVPGVPVVMLGALDDFEGALEAIGAGAQDVLLGDGEDAFSMARRIRFALEREQLRRAAPELLQHA